MRHAISKEQLAFAEWCVGTPYLHALARVSLLQMAGIHSYSNLPCSQGVRDLLHPDPKAEKTRHKKKRLVQVGWSPGVQPLRNSTPCLS